MSVQFVMFPFPKLPFMNKSSHNYLYIALFTTQIVSKQLYRDNRKIMQSK